MFKLFIFLLLSCVSGFAATGGGSIAAKVSYVNFNGNALLSGLSLTNVGTRSTAGTLVYAGPGTFWIGTNQQSLLAKGVNLYLSPGTILTMGVATDGISDNAILDDILDGQGARTNSIYGEGEIYMTNTLGRLLLSTDGGSKWYIRCKVARVMGQNPLISLDAGGLDYAASDQSRSDQYDVITTGNPAPQYCYFSSTRAYAGDSIVEMGAGMTNWGDAVFNINYGEALSTGGGFGIGALCIGGNAVFNIDVLNFKRSAAGIYGTATNQNDIGNGVLRNCIIRSLPASTVSTVQRGDNTFGTAFKLENCTIIGPTGVDPIEANPMAGKLTVKDCVIITGSSATNWVRPSAAGNCNVVVQGGLSVNRTNHANVTTIGKSYTTNSTAEIAF